MKLIYAMSNVIVIFYRLEMRAGISVLLAEEPRSAVANMFRLTLNPITVSGRRNQESVKMLSLVRAYDIV